MNVLAFFAPDDETMLMAVLALLALGDAQVHYLCATL
jgi:LmbE family N-acetylglucosaminyl deacetylase